MRKSKLRFWGFLAPSLIAFCIVVIIPTCIGFFYSLTNWNGIVGSDIKFVGFQNFIDIFTRDDSFVHAFLFTALFSVCAVVLVNFVGFALALLVTQKFRGATLLRGIFFMPNMIGGLLLGFTWQFIFISIFEAFSKKTGIAAFSGWLSNPETGFIGLLILTVWQMSGYMMIVYIAQIQQIPESVKEAARNDFLLPSLIINKQGLQTLPLKTYLFFGQFAKRWDLASAGLVMCMAPIIIFYLFSQKYIVKGITEGAIK